MTADHAAAAEALLLGHVRDGPPPPQTIEELCAATGLDPLACGRALLDLHERGLLEVTPLPGDRFALAAPGPGPGGPSYSGVRRC